MASFCAAIPDTGSDLSAGVPDPFTGDISTVDPSTIDVGNLGTADPSLDTGSLLASGPGIIGAGPISASNPNTPGLTALGAAPPPSILSTILGIAGIGSQIAGATAARTSPTTATTAQKVAAKPATVGSSNTLLFVVIGVFFGLLYFIGSR